jgi:tellurite methyltransferase
MVVDLNSRYGLSASHSEVVEACKIIEPCDTLDMGCSNGRNAVYLGQRGFNVTAIDANPGAINMLQSIINEEKMDTIQAQVYDINNANLSEDYGFISCTVTLMFMDTTRVDYILDIMKERTLAGVY